MVQPAPTTEPMPRDERANLIEYQDYYLTVDDRQVEVRTARPLNPDPDTPGVLLLPGWGEPAANFMNLLTTCADNGYRAAALSQPRRGIEDWEAAPQFFPVAIRRRARVAAAVVEHLDYGKTHLIGHSGGGPDAIALAWATPERVASVWLMNAAGISNPEKPTLSNMGGRFVRKAGLQAKEAIMDRQLVRNSKLGGRALWYVGRNFPRAVDEATAIAQAPIEECFEYLEENGVKIFAFDGVDDPVSEAGVVQQKLGKFGPSKLDRLAGVITVRQGHDTMHTDKEYGEALVTLLKAADRNS